MRETHTETDRQAGERSGGVRNATKTDKGKEQRQ